MARISMTGGFMMVPAGTHIFRIYGVDYDEDFGVLTVYLINAKGMTHRERFGLKNANGEPNDGAMGAFSYFAKCAMNDFEMEDLDPEDLVGHYIEAEVIHTEVPSTKEGQEGKMRTFANLGDKAPAEGFDTEPVAKALTKVLEDSERPGKRRDRKSSKKPAPAPQNESETIEKLDLDSLLG